MSDFQVTKLDEGIHLYGAYPQSGMGRLFLGCVVPMETGWMCAVPSIDEVSIDFFGAGLTHFGAADTALILFSARVDCSGCNGFTERIRVSRWDRASYLGKLVESETHVVNLETEKVMDLAGKDLNLLPVYACAECGEHQLVSVVQVAILGDGPQEVMEKAFAESFVQAVDKGSDLDLSDRIRGT